MDDTAIGSPKRKYSKSSAFYKETKRDFFTNNDSLLRKAEAQNSLYAAQPKRDRCKICCNPLKELMDFQQHGVIYVFCSNCGHLNGTQLDTQAFTDQLYVADDGSEYARNYLDEDFGRRAEDIYVPKVEFLLSSIPTMNRHLLDAGCGGGYFVYSAIKNGIFATGVDLGRSLIEYGNNQIYRLINKRPLSVCDEDSLLQSIANTDASVISAVGVIEHLRDLDRFFIAFRQSRAKYIFYSVPMFSLSVIIENVFRTIFPRQLSGGHTHLFTERSVAKLNELLGVRSIAEWRFGTDIMDLYRSVSLTILANKSSALVFNYLDEGFGSKIDEFQGILDRNHFCSEIHLVAAKP